MLDLLLVYISGKEDGKRERERERERENSRRIFLSPVKSVNGSKQAWLLRHDQIKFNSCIACE